jgi:hypothetical protein
LTIDKRNDTLFGKLIRYPTPSIRTAMSPKITHLKQRQAELKKQICDNLDLLMGTINRSPAMMYYGLTTKVEGKTVSRYVRKAWVPKVKKMTDRHKRVRAMIKELSDINWELLRHQSD